MLLLTRQFDCKTYIEKLCKKKQRPYSPTAMLIAFFNANFKLVPQFFQQKLRYLCTTYFYEGKQNAPSYSNRVMMVYLRRGCLYQGCLSIL